MISALRLGTLAVALLAVASCGAVSAPDAEVATDDEASPLPTTLRVATFNIRELSTEALLEVDENGAGTNAGIRAAAEVVGVVRPDVLVVQEIDHDYSSPGDLALNARRLRDSYLRTALLASDFPYLYAAPCNTGIPSGHDLNRDGEVTGDDSVGSREYGEDCFGFGRYPGQYSMAILSRYPIDAANVRTFREFLWRDLPGHHLPEEFYGEVTDALRLSSKSHWDVPVKVADRTLHLWVSHPTPSVFDGEEDRNGRRNYDEIAFWIAYLDGEAALYDDEGKRGGYDSARSFVVAGDLNSDPRSDGAFYDGRQSIDQLLNDPRIQDPGALLESEGAAEGDPDDQLAARATATFGGGMRVDYLLPSAELSVTGGGVYWPTESSNFVGSSLAAQASDHRLVWLDIDPETLR